MAKIKYGDKILLVNSEGRKYIVSAGSGKLSTDKACIDLKKLVGREFGLETEGFAVLQPGFQDLLQKTKRGPAVILPKDAAQIIIYAGVNSNSKVVDVGTGSGWLAAQLANIAGEVVTYEIRKDFAELARKNFEMLGLKNITVKEKDACKKIFEKDVDLVTLDIAEPWQALKSAGFALKAGGFMVAYCPQITQVIKLVEHLDKKSWLLERVSEVIERSWKIEGLIARPEHQMLGHTAFLVMARKI